jgi:hypothetical protein
MLENWRAQMAELSGNLTTNNAMPQWIADKLLEEDASLKEKLSFEEIHFPLIEGKLDTIKGLEIVAGLQNKTKQDCMTLFRAVRFPTFKRMHEMMYEHGCSISNYEQERITTLYAETTYIEKREALKSDPLFHIQPQERVVPGIPLFALANDALQIHRAYRGLEDMLAMCAIHIPEELVTSQEIKLIANTAIDLNHDTNERDFEIRDFRKKNGKIEINFSSLRVRGIDLHEMYTKDLPLGVKEMEARGINTEYFLLNIARITDETRMNEIFSDTDVLKKNEYFMHGFFGDQNIFGRRRSQYLPTKCQSIKKRV